MVAEQVQRPARGAGWWLTRGLAVLVVLVVGKAAYGAWGSDDRHGEVVRVIDGDTLVALVDGEETTIRLLNVDTPETKHPDEEVQCLGPEATAFLTERLPAGTEIELEYDEERTDRYDRTLAGVFESGSLINAEIAAEGLGVPVLFEPNARFYPEVEEASRTAQDAGRGLFSPSIQCALPAQLQALGEEAAQVPATVEGDPAAALAEATALVGDIDVFIAALAPGELAGLGNAVMGEPSMAAYLEDLRIEAGDMRSGADEARAALDESKADYDAEQERLEREERERKEREEREERERLEREEKERQEREEQERLEQEERERTQKDSDAAKPAPASSTTSGNSGSGGGATESSQPEPEHAPQPAPKPEPAPNPEPEEPASGSGCTPYGPEISYADDGGYTGKRYGMPGGGTFRKCR